MFNRFFYNQPLYNEETNGFSALAATVADAGSTRSPFAHILVAIPGGDLIFIYQDGTAGLVYRISSDGGITWGAVRVIDTDTTVYASAVVNLTTKDIHVVYSKQGTTPATDESIYYRPLFYDSVALDWVTGGEQILAGSGGLYDSATAGRRNASISAATDGRLVVTYLRNVGGVVTWATLVSQTSWSTADMDTELDIGLAADEDTRGATQQSINVTSDYLWQVSRTGSTYSVSHVFMPTPLGAIDVLTDDTWFGDAGEMISVSYDSGLDRLGIVYLKNSKPHFRLYTLGVSPTLVSDTEMATNSTQSVSIAWDGSRFWMGWVTNDVVKISNSDAPTVVVQTFDNPGPDEDWSWLNTAVTLLETTRIVFVWSQTNGGATNNIYVGSFTTSRAVSGSESGAGTDVMTVGIPIPETGVGDDTMSASQSIATTDSGVGADALSSLRISVTDTGTGVDAISKDVHEGETASGSETMRIGLTGTETGAGDDSMSITVSLSLTDTGAGVDAISLRLPLTDAGAGVEGASTNNGSEETGVGTDVMRVGLTGTENGAGTDAMNVQINLADSGVGVDALGSVNKNNTEVGVGTDTMAVGVTIAEAGSGEDAVSSLRIIVTDNGTGVDAVTGGVPVSITTAVFVRLLMSSGNVKLKAES